jgi:glycosyltransferase involved in cell wall biosynthesis
VRAAAGLTLTLPSSRPSLKRARHKRGTFVSITEIGPEARRGTSVVEDRAGLRSGARRNALGRRLLDGSMPLRIALVAPPLLPVPPPAYGGTERVIDALARSLVDLGHDVTVFASGDSATAGRLVPTVDRAAWTGGSFEAHEGFARTISAVAGLWDQFDVIHSHLDSWGFPLTRASPTPVVSTLHGRLDDPLTAAGLRQYPDARVIAISESQRATRPDANWVGVVHNGQDFAPASFRDLPRDYLLFVGRVTHEKGIDRAIRAAALAGERLVIAAKVQAPAELETFESIVRPALRQGAVEYVGEVSGAVRDQLFAGAKATLMLGRWPEPFGLVAIESLATGTPVIATPHGALPEIVEPGLDGAIVKDAASAALAVRDVVRLDPQAIRSRALRRFSSQRMAARYVGLYEQVLATGAQAATRAYAPLGRS